MFNKKTSKKFLSIAAASTIAITGFTGLGSSKASAKEVNNQNPKNVIFLIGDGMGPAFTTAYRYFKDDLSTRVMEDTVFDPYLVGMQKTYSWDEEQNITDSGAAATSMASAVKTYNGAIGVDIDKKEVGTVLEAAKAKNKATGIVATSQVNHATPAAFGAHDVSRKNYNAIADDYFDELVNGQHKIDVILGGGTAYFERKDRNLAGEFKNAGYSYVKTKDELLSNKNDQILGLFDKKGMPKAIDRPSNMPSLKDMTQSAIDRLSKDKEGFFLMVEGSEIDWAGHDNDIVAAMSDMEDFAQAFKAAIDFAKKDGNTLVVTTADHSTGGLTIAQGGPYVYNPSAIKAAKRTPDYMAQQIAGGADVEATLSKYIDLTLTAEEIQSVKDAKANAAEGKEVVTVDNAIENIFNERSRTGWTTSGHTGVDVQVFAYGPGKERFLGLQENTNTATQIFDILTAQKQQQSKAKNSVVFNNKVLHSQPAIVNGRTLLHVRSLFEDLGATVAWDNKAKVATIEKGATKVELNVTNNTAVVNGQEVTIDQSAKIMNGKTMIPVRLVAEALGATVKWDQTNRTVYITK